MGDPVLVVAALLPMAIFPAVSIAGPIPVAMNPESVWRGLRGYHFHSGRWRRGGGDDGNTRPRVSDMGGRDRACAAQGEQGAGRDGADEWVLHGDLHFVNHWATPPWREQAPL